MKAILRIVALILLAVGIMLPMAGCSVKEKHYHSSPAPAPRHHKAAPAPRKHYKPAPPRKHVKPAPRKAAPKAKPAPKKNYR